VHELRPWALWVSLAAILLATLACVGAGFALAPPSLENRIASLTTPGNESSLPDGISSDDLDTLNTAAFNPDAANPPGLGIPSLALVNGLLFIVIALTALPLIIGNRPTALVNGIVSVLGGLVAVLVGIMMAIVAFVALTLMITLFLATPFGTLAYLAVFGFFDVSTSSAVLGLVLLLQLVGVVFLVVAQQRFLASKRLMFFILIALLLTFLTTVLHSIVPIVLVSITDALAALISAVVGIVWGLAVLIGGLISLVKQLQLGRQGGAPLREREPTERLDGRRGPIAPVQPSGGMTRTAHGARPRHSIVSTVPAS
jgi:hypothetical protein